MLPTRILHRLGILFRCYPKDLPQPTMVLLGNPTKVFWKFLVVEIHEHKITWPDGESGCSEAHAIPRLRELIKKESS